MRRGTRRGCDGRRSSGLRYHWSTPGGATLTVTLSFQGTAVSQALGRFRLSVTGDEDPLRVVSIRAKTRAALERASPNGRTTRRTR